MSGWLKVVSPVNGYQVKASFSVVNAAISHLLTAVRLRHVWWSWSSEADELNMKRDACYDFSVPQFHPPGINIY
jgi:hypothetical protein